MKPEETQQLRQIVDQLGHAVDAIADREGKRHSRTPDAQRPHPTGTRRPAGWGLARGRHPLWTPGRATAR